jgi:hypothetical protein
MAINQNHLFEELDGTKCAIVEKNVSPARVDFLRRILEYNRFTVVAVPSPPPKVAAAPAPARPAAAAPATDPSVPPVTDPPEPPAPSPPPPAPATFTVGVTDTMFNPVNALFGRLLRTPDGHIVTLAYWQQKDEQSNDAVPYFNQR